jgi:hypothetical protein
VRSAAAGSGRGRRTSPTAAASGACACVLLPLSFQTLDGLSSCDITARVDWFSDAVGTTSS